MSISLAYLGKPIVIYSSQQINMKSMAQLLWMIFFLWLFQNLHYEDDRLYYNANCKIYIK